MIKAEHIKVGAQFELPDSSVFEITDLEPYSDGTPAARSCFPGLRSDFRDPIDEIVEFLNEEGARLL